MPFLVQGRRGDHTLSVTADTAKEALSKAIEWHVIKKFFGVSIYDGARMYSIEEFALAMALLQIAKTAESDAGQMSERR